MARRKFIPIPAFTEKDRERYWSKVDRSRGPDACWLWKTGLNIQGYGAFRVGRLKERGTFRAHRIAYFLEYGIDPEHLMVCHHCDTPACNNPAHLFLGTNTDNCRDAASKGRVQSGENHHTKRHPELVQRGDKCPFSQLKEADVVEIKRLRASGWLYREIGAKFGVSGDHICGIVNRKYWKHVL